MCKNQQIELECNLSEENISRMLGFDVGKDQKSMMGGQYALL